MVLTKAAQHKTKNVIGQWHDAHEMTMQAHHLMANAGDGGQSACLETGAMVLEGWPATCFFEYSGPYFATNLGLVWCGYRLSSILVIKFPLTLSLNVCISSRSFLSLAYFILPLRSRDAIITYWTIKPQAKRAREYTIT